MKQYPKPSWAKISQIRTLEDLNIILGRSAQNKQLRKHTRIIVDNKMAVNPGYRLNECDNKSRKNINVVIS